VNVPRRRADRVESELNVAEFFVSIQGETSYAGLPCAFVRTAGCNLRCSYCDTRYAQDPASGTRMSVAEICRRVERAGARLACITGGEPLLQAEAAAELARRLLEAGQTVLVETNGTLDFGLLPEGSVVIMDVKCPGSGECGKTLPANLSRLRPRDEVKFVISDRADFEWAVEFVRAGKMPGGPHVLFAPAHGRLEARTLADWILEGKIEARLQLQLHKILWPESKRGA